MKSNPNWPLSTWLIIILLCVLRACHLHWSSTKDLRATQGPPWPLPHRLQTSEESYMRSLVANNDTTSIGSSSSNLFYFIQISDLHLSKYRANGHTLHFLHFLQTVLPTVNPSFVVVTGDLTDAKDARRITSQQYLEEWQVYRKAIDERAGDILWYDMRGNHDCFDLPSWQSHVNLYRSYGRSADLVESGRGVYTWQLDQDDGRYRFVAIDACPKRGPSRPLNFFGYLTSRTMDRLADALSPGAYNHTFVFSHYPTTTMVFGTSSKGHSFRDLAKRFSIYFCGHLHRLTAGLGDVLQWYNPRTQSLELELGDMMSHAVYRIVAVDHDLISFNDFSLETALSSSKKSTAIAPTTTTSGEIIWPETLPMQPMIVITNPKDARFAIPSKEPLDRMRKSSHVRFLIFSRQEVSDVRVLIDGSRLQGEPEQVVVMPEEGKNEKKNTLPPPLWTLPWDPATWDDGKLHTLQIDAIASDGQKGTASIKFRLDSKRAEIQGGPGEFIISSSMTLVLQGMTLTAIAVLLGLLVIVPKIPPRDRSAALQRMHRLPRTSLKRHILAWRFRFTDLPEDQPWCWIASVLFLLALITLPWFRAEFIPSASMPSERYGLFYLWGLKFGDEWIPIADTWMFAANQIWLDVAVFIVLFAWRSTRTGDLRGTCQPKTMKDDRQWHEYAWFKGLEILYWLWRVSELAALASFYGGMSTLVFNILVAWTAFVGGVLAYGKGGLFQTRKQEEQLDGDNCVCGLKCAETLKQRIDSDDQDVEQTTITATNNTAEEEDIHLLSFESTTAASRGRRVKSRKRSLKVT